MTKALLRINRQWGARGLACRVVFLSLFFAAAALAAPVNDSAIPVFGSANPKGGLTLSTPTQIVILLTLLTLLPAVAAVATIGLVIGTARWARRANLGKGRVATALEALSDGVEESLRVIRRGDPRLLGALAYWLFDNLALYACLAAFAHTPTVWVVGIAYLVGMLANSIPVPAGLVAVEGGLVGMLVLFGVRPATKVLAAVVIYRAISLWVPAVIGSLAFLSLRREIAKGPIAEPVPAS